MPLTFLAQESPHQITLAKLRVALTRAGDPFSPTCSASAVFLPSTGTAAERADDETWPLPRGLTSEIANKHLYTIQLKTKSQLILSDSLFFKKEILCNWCDIFKARINGISIWQFSQLISFNYVSNWIA